MDVDGADGRFWATFVARRCVHVDGGRARHRRRVSRQRRRHDRLERDGGRRGPQPAAAAGARTRGAVRRLGDGAAELRVHGQVEHEVEREVGRLQRVGDDDRRLQQRALGRLGRVEVEIDEFRRRDEQQEHGDDADQREREPSFRALCRRLDGQAARNTARRRRTVHPGHLVRLSQRTGVFSTSCLTRCPKQDFSVDNTSPRIE